MKEGTEGEKKKCEVNAPGEGRGGERERIGKEKMEEGKNEDNKKGFSVEGRTSYSGRGEEERKRWETEREEEEYEERKWGKGDKMRKEGRWEMRGGWKTNSNRPTEQPPENERQLDKETFQDRQQTKGEIRNTYKLC